MAVNNPSKPKELREILKHFEDWCFCVTTLKPPAGGELNIKEAEAAILKWVADNYVPARDYMAVQDILYEEYKAKTAEAVIAELEKYREDYKLNPSHDWNYIDDRIKELKGRN